MSSPMPQRPSPPLAQNLPPRVIIDSYGTASAGRWGMTVIEADGTYFSTVEDLPATPATPTAATDPDSPSTNYELEASLLAFSAAMDLSADRGALRLDILNKDLRTRVACMASQLTGIELYVGDDEGGHAEKLRAEVRAGLVPPLLKAVEPVAVQVPNAPKHRGLVVIISSDASICRTSDLAGLGWVAASPHDGSIYLCGLRVQKVRVGDIISGELAAIQHAVANVQGERTKKSPCTFRIISDSMPALSILRAVQGGQTLPRSTEAQIRIAVDILSYGTRRQIDFDFVWVKGHSGDVMNDGADRLAVLARRNKEFMIPADVRAKLFEAASEDIVRMVA